MSDNIKCNECGWTGTEAELVDRVTRNGGDESQCPECGAFEELEEVKEIISEQTPDCYICGQKLPKMHKVLNKWYCWICFNEYGKEG